MEGHENAYCRKGEAGMKRSTKVALVIALVFFIIGMSMMGIAAAVIGTDTPWDAYNPEVTEKERGVILKKATAAGYDADEVEILLDGKLAEKKNECQSVSETETKVESKLTPKAGENEADVAVGEVDTDAMWADVVAQLDVVKNSITCPKGRPYISFASKTHKKNISYWAGYSPRGEYAWVCIETYGGEAARDAIMSIVKSAPKGHICTAAEMKQGARNKEKWALTVTTSIDKPTSELVEWYVESLLAYYKFFEDAKPF
jgi:hypothetical protein